MKKSASLFYKSGTSDKEYHLQLIEKGDKWVVNYQYGRRGGNLKAATKTPNPLSYEEADKIYTAKLKEQLSEGYQYGEVKSDFSVEMKPRDKMVHILPQLLNVIEDADLFINDDAWMGQEKKDGERRLVISSNKIIGLNKKGEETPLPDSIIKSINDICILDGEIIGSKLYVFDILSLNDRNLKGLPAEERLETLRHLKFGKGIEVVETAFSKRDKRIMFDTLKKNKAEGMVFKKKDSIYEAGRPASGGNQRKFKFYKTATFIVFNITAGKRSVGLELIDDNTNKRVFMGKVTIPPDQNIPNVGDLVEVRYLYAYLGGAVYQPTYLGKRNDQDLTDATMKQIVYKAERNDDEE